MLCRGRYICWSVVLGGSTLAAAGQCFSLPATDGPAAARLLEIDEQPRLPSTYCGVCVLTRAMRALGKDVALGELVRPEYIGSRGGSSAEELVQAAKDFDVHCERFDLMTCGSLRRAPFPIILHVKSTLEAPQYDHWVLLMGFDEGNARIYDGVEPLRLVGYDELSARWDGTCLAVSDEPIGRLPILFERFMTCVFYTSIALLAVGLIRLGEHRFESRCWRRGRFGTCAYGLAQSAVVLAVALSCFALYRSSRGEGFLSYGPMISAIQDAKLRVLLPKVRVEDVAELQRSRETVFVDARSPRRFKAGHLHRAVNVPPASTPEDCARALSGVSKRIRLVVYCDRRGSPYSEIVARNLAACGFRNLALFEGGWLEYEEFIRNSAE